MEFKNLEGHEGHDNIKKLNSPKRGVKNKKIYKLITLKEEESILDGLELYEKPNINMINKLLKSDLLENVKYKDFNYENERHHLETYKRCINDDLVKVSYNKHKLLKIGRVYAKKSLSAINLRREIRGSIFNGNYIDIDIVNCHPNIIYQLAVVLKIECKNLEEYIKNRENVLLEIQTYYNINRDIAKELFIRLLYFGSFTKWAMDNDVNKPITNFINNVSKELLNIGAKIIENNNKLKNKIEKHLKTNNQYNDDLKTNKTTISYYVQEIENKILEEIYIYCIDKGIIKDNLCCLCYDGIMIIKENYKRELLLEFNKIIIKKFGLNLIFEQKDMKNYIDIIDEHKIENIEQYNELIEILDNLNKNKWDKYEEWFKIYCVFVNENYPLGIFETYSRKYNKHEEFKNKEILLAVDKNDTGFSKKTLYDMLKIDNIDKYNKLILKCFDIYKLAQDLTQNVIAEYYYSLEMNKYVRSSKTGWYEYNKYNVLIPFGMKEPDSLLNNLSNKLQEIFITERNKLIPPIKKNNEDSETYKIRDKMHKDAIKIYDRAYKTIGNSKYTKCCIDYLKLLYTIDRLDDKLDSKNNLLAFDNKL
jgi:hypothetical protein